MKLKLTRDNRIDGKAGDIVEVSPDRAAFLLEFGLAEPVLIREDIRRVMNFCGDRLDEIIRKPEYREIGFIAATEGNRNEWPELMVECDIAVTDGDGPDREPAAMGLPTVLIRPEDPPEERLRTALRLGHEERRRMQARQLGRKLRNGRRKVMNLIENM